MAVWRAIDLVLRLVYVFAVPILLAPLTVVFPITATLVGAGLATIVSLIGSERWQATVGRIPVLGRALGGMTAVGDFYREHPPKPLVYYIFYPLLLPVILFMRVPRREFLLYRRLNAIALVVVVITGVYDYFHNWRPELSFAQFVGMSIVTFILQLLATFSLVMPIVTTLLILRTRGRGKMLSAVVVGIGVMSVLGVLVSHRMKNGVQIGTWMRVQARTQAGFREFRQCAAEQHGDSRGCARKNKAFVALVEALDQVYLALKDHPDDKDAALDRARDKIGEYYKPDETAAFELYADEGVYILYVFYAKHDVVWLGRDARQLITDPAKLPPGARTLLTLK